MRRVVFLIFALCIPVAHAVDDPPEITRWRADLQQKIDAAISEADMVLVEAVEGKDAKRFLWQSSNPKDLRPLAGAFRVKTPKYRRQVIDGKEEIVVSSRSCFCYGQLWVSFKRGHDVLLILLIKHGTMIGSEQLGPLDVEQAPLAPFYNRMMALAKETKANKAPLPTPASVTPAAGAPGAPPSGAAGL